MAISVRYNSLARCCTWWLNSPPTPGYLGTNFNYLYCRRTLNVPNGSKIEHVIKQLVRVAGCCNFLNEIAFGVGE